MKMTTAIVNSTNDVLKVKMGGPQQSAEVASIDKGGQWELHVNPNQTYREYRVVDSSGTEAAIVSSDDCCDNQCITIKEAAAAGAGAARKYEVHRVPRRQHKPSQTSLLQVPEAYSPPPKAESKLLTWFGWLRQLWAKK